MPLKTDDRPKQNRGCDRLRTDLMPKKEVSGDEQNRGCDCLRKGSVEWWMHTEGDDGI
jgi:hypothetical protein